jgi:hypothetical protein
MEKQLEIVHLPFPQRLDSAAELSKWASERAKQSIFECGSSASKCSVMESAHASDAIFEARLNIIHTILAIERYCLANQNRLPESLSALVPSMLDSVPPDPFDGKPLRYKKLIKGYMVYSIGLDRKDDAGLPRFGVTTDVGVYGHEIWTNDLPRRFGPPPISPPLRPGTSQIGFTNWDITFVVEH